MVVMGHRTTAYAYLFRAGTVVCKVFAAQVARGTDVSREEEGWGGGRGVKG